MWLRPNPASAPPHGHLRALQGGEATAAGSALGRPRPGPRPGPAQAPAPSWAGLGPAPLRPQPHSSPAPFRPRPTQAPPRGGRRGGPRRHVFRRSGPPAGGAERVQRSCRVAALAVGRRRAWLRRRWRWPVGPGRGGRRQPCGAAAGLRLGVGRARAPPGPSALHLGPSRTGSATCGSATRRRRGARTVSAAAPPEPRYLGGVLPAGLRRRVPSHAVTLQPVPVPPNGDPRSPSPPTAGDIASAVRLRETRKNAPPETLQCLPFSWENCFINFWDFVASNLYWKGLGLSRGVHRHLSGGGHPHAPLGIVINKQ